MAVVQHTITTVISEFLGSAPTLEEIIAFSLPEPLELRGLELLERHRSGQITPEERAELDEFTRMGHFMNRVKLQARLKLADQT
ncbi:MAG: hypothetical protein J0M07_01955 [Anaerolineae bacterium]|nr:hypothetical protein [Anaerolineae bacterium]